MWNILYMWNILSFFDGYMDYEDYEARAGFLGPRAVSKEQPHAVRVEPQGPNMAVAMKPRRI